MAQEKTPRYLQEIEEILREHDQGDEPSEWLKMTEELIKITREVESPSGRLGQFIDRVLKHATGKNGSLVVAYIGFRIGVAYERYQKANKT